MTRDDFWKFIEDTRPGDDPDAHAAAIRNALAQRTAAEILGFEERRAELMGASYIWPLWGAAYLINGGCSDDGFDYFRGWLMSQGQTVFERVLVDPDSLADLPDLDGDVECEDVLYVAREAYESVSGTEMPYIPIKHADFGEDWDFDDDEEMRTRYPKLFARFCAG